MSIFLPRNLRRIARHLLLALPALLLCSACEHYDPNYKTLAAAAESNPNPMAIHGMWHRTGAVMMVKDQISIIFLPNKVGHYDSLTTDRLFAYDHQGKFTWNYAGNGLWTTAMAPDSPSESGFGWWLTNPTKWRVSGTRLLQETSFRAGKYFWVWERVKQ